MIGPSQVYLKMKLIQSHFYQVGQVLRILKKCRGIYYEDLARSCEHLNFPAHFSTKKNLATSQKTLQLQQWSLERFCLGRKIKIQILNGSSQ